MRALPLAALMLFAAAAPAAAAVDTGTLADGARWEAEVPAAWNGTLLLWSRGYSPSAGRGEAAPAPLRQRLLAAGYALAGSDYGAGGWALEEAVPAQRGTVAAFTSRFGRPKRVIGWGYSMGGLVTTALAEAPRPAIDGAVAMCASIGGSVGMLNMALDGAYAFRTLVAPDAGIRLTGIDDDRANAARVNAALAAATKTAPGRARVALAGVLAGIPGWTTPDREAPAAGDAEAQAAEIARVFAMGVFLPRVDQERRAGGAFSWNDGVDYRAQLARSGRRGFVEELYRRAGLDLDADLATLNAGTRVTAKPTAVAYMMRHYVPNARPRVPLAAVQMAGDGLTSPSMQRGYAEAARGHRVMSLWVRGAGHCSFAPDTVMAALAYMDARLRTGRWPPRPAAFVDHTPAPDLRRCFRGGRCR